MNGFEAMNGFELLSQLMTELDEAFVTGRFRGRELHQYAGVCNALNMELLHLQEGCPAAEAANSLFNQACVDLKQMDAILERGYPVSCTHEQDGAEQFAAAFITPARDYTMMWTGDYGIARRRFVNTVSLILRMGKDELERTTGAFASAMPAFEEFRKVVNASTFPSEERGLLAAPSELMCRIAYASQSPFLCIAFREAGVRGFETHMLQLLGTQSIITYALRRLQDRGTPIAMRVHSEHEFILITRIARMRYLRAYQRWIMEGAR